MSEPSQEGQSVCLLLVCVNSLSLRYFWKTGLVAWAEIPFEFCGLCTCPAPPRNTFCTWIKARSKSLPVFCRGKRSVCVQTCKTLLVAGLGRPQFLGMLCVSRCCELAPAASEASPQECARPGRRNCCSALLPALRGLPTNS